MYQSNHLCPCMLKHNTYILLTTAFKLTGKYWYTCMCVCVCVCVCVYSACITHIGSSREVCKNLSNNLINLWSLVVYYICTMYPLPNFFCFSISIYWILFHNLEDYKLSYINMIKHLIVAVTYIGEGEWFILCMYTWNPRPI